MDLKRIKRLLIKGKFKRLFNKDIDINMRIALFKNEGVFEILNENQYFYDKYILLKKKYSLIRDNHEYATLPELDMLILLICIINNIDMKYWYIGYYTTVDDFIEVFINDEISISENNIKYLVKNSNCDCYEKIIKKAYSMKTQCVIKTDILLTKMDNYDENIKGYIFDNIKSYLLCEECEEYRDDFILSNLTIVEELVKRNKLIMFRKFHCLIVHCLINNLDEVLDIVLKHKSSMNVDKIRGERYFNNMNNIKLENLCKINSLEGFDDFLKNNYELLMKKCNKEVVNYIKSYI